MEQSQAALQNFTTALDLRPSAGDMNAIKVRGEECMIARMEVGALERMTFCRGGGGV